MDNIDNINITDLTVAGAVKLYKQGDIDAAQTMFLKVLDIDAKNPDALYFMSMIDHSSGRSEVAENRAKDLLLVKPTDGKALNLLGTILMSQGKIEEALTHFNKGIKYNEDDAMLRVNAAICHIGEGNPHTSIERCKEAISISPEYANAYNILGNAYMGISDMKNAASSFRQAIERNPDFNDAQFNLGVSLFELNEYDNALECFNQVLEKSENNVHALTRKADVHLMKNELENAAALYGSAIKLNNNFAPAHIGLGKLFQQLKKHDDALSHFNKALELNPDSIEALINAGVSFQKTNNAEAAAAAFNDVLKIDADNSQAKFLLATVQDTAPPAKPDGDYVKRLFDEFANTFDESLNKVGYDAPKQLITLAKQLLDSEKPQLNIIDIGCGTGLTGVEFKPLAQNLKGIDISPRMLDNAKKRGIYDELEENEILNSLVRHQNDTDMIISADTFPYFGDLESIFLSVASALKDQGLFLFTVETHDSDAEYILGKTARYSHSRQYIEDVAKRRGLSIVWCENTVYRKEAGSDVSSLIIAMKKP